METPRDAEGKKTACILCSLNCGLEVHTRDGHLVRVKGDPAHPVSRGYLCEKPQRLDHYQNAADRLTSPMRRRADGTYEAVDWDTAFREIAARLNDVRQRHGGESILFYGGGGQGNHLGGAYADTLLKVLGNKYRSNALAQEKTGEFWVQGKMLGTGSHGDFEHCDVALFIGKNPWQSHGFPRARAVLKALQKDPARTLIVIDPRRSETAAMADVHLALRPGTDAWCLAALVAILVQDDLVNHAWLGDHTTGWAEVRAAFARIPVAHCAEVCGIAESELRRVAGLLSRAKALSTFEDLGLQQNVHSTLGSWLQRLLWVLTGHYGREGTQNATVPFLSLSKASKGDTGFGEGAAPREKTSPVTGSKIIIGLIPCNVIPDEILTDHPKRFRALLVQSGNPVHSLADSPRMRQAMRALELSVVVDVAMTETAREADYVLPSSSQFEKAEATFFSQDHPDNAFHVRQPVFHPLHGTLPEAEIFARLTEAVGGIQDRDYAPLHIAARLGRPAFTAAFLALAVLRPRTLALAPVLLYRTLGPMLPPGMSSAAAVWGMALLYTRAHPVAAARAGFGGPFFVAANRLFDALLAQPSGVVFARSTYEESWTAIRTEGHRIRLWIPELAEALASLATTSLEVDPAFPFVLSAGERRSETANTLVRDATWHARGLLGALRIHPEDGASLGCTEGDTVRITTSVGTALAAVSFSDTLHRGHVSLPNGLGLTFAPPGGTAVVRGAAPNELTDGRRRDFLAGTPWHKHVPARLERVA